MESSMSCMQMIKFSLSKLVMEFTGTLFFTMFFTAGASLTVDLSDITGVDISYNFSGTSQSIILLGLWILNVFFWKISGSHFNPAVTFAFMFRRDERKMHWKLALAYIVCQLAGGYVGALLVNFYTFNLQELDFEGSFFLRALC